MKFETGVESYYGKRLYRLDWFGQSIFSISETVNFKIMIKVSSYSTFLYLRLKHFLF